MQRCPKCRRVYADGIFTFCLDDGALLPAPDDSGEAETIVASKPPVIESAPDAPPDSTARKSNKLFWLAGGAVLVFGAVLALYFSSSFLGLKDKTKQFNNLSPDEAIKKGIAAVVNGDPILLKDVDREAKTIEAQLEAAKISTGEQKTARLKALDSLIQQELWFQLAKKEQISASEDEVASFIGGLKQSMSQERYQSFLADWGMTETELREYGRKQLSVRKLVEKLGQKVEPPTDAEVEAYFKANNKDDKKTLDTPGARQGAVDEIIAQRRSNLAREMAEKAEREAKIINYLAQSSNN